MGNFIFWIVKLLLIPFKGLKIGYTYFIDILVNRIGFLRRQRIDETKRDNSCHEATNDYGDHKKFDRSFVWKEKKPNTTTIQHETLSRNQNIIRHTTDIFKEDDGTAQFRKIPERGITILTETERIKPIIRLGGSTIKQEYPSGIVTSTPKEQSSKLSENNDRCLLPIISSLKTNEPSRKSNVSKHRTCDSNERGNKGSGNETTAVGLTTRLKGCEIKPPLYKKDKQRKLTNESHIQKEYFCPFKQSIKGQDKSNLKNTTWYSPGFQRREKRTMYGSDLRNDSDVLYNAKCTQQLFEDQHQEQTYTKSKKENNKIKKIPHCKSNSMDSQIVSSRSDQVSWSNASKCIRPADKPSYIHVTQCHNFYGTENLATRNNRQPSQITSEKSWKPRYNDIRCKKYRKTNLSSQHNETILQFHTERVTLDKDIKDETHHIINSLLNFILTNEENRGRFSTEPVIEGSNAVGVKIGNADELDYSVDIFIDCKRIRLSDSPIKFEFEEDDIDNYDIKEISTTFVDAGKRYFPDDGRKYCINPNPPNMRNGFTAVSISKKDNKGFQNCCTRDEKWLWILPYYLLYEFHRFVGNAMPEQDGVSLNRGAKGPAVTLTVQQSGGPNISVDITPKITLQNETMNVSEFGWPRRDTKRWLTEDKIESILSQQIYLVPKGDKYWKISYANCEYEILRDMDKRNTRRKTCLRIMKKKLMQWQSRSTTGLKGISSYLLKTTLLWLCEILPEDEYWYKEEVANRYLNFLQEFEHRVRKRYIGEYFNQSVNLLENKDDNCLDELEELIQEEISKFKE